MQGSANEPARPGTVGDDGLVGCAPPARRRSGRTASAGARIGTCGWQYDHWRGRFYPADLPTPGWLRFYADHFDAVEVDRTFYSLPAATVYESWRESVPAGFVFTLKFSRFATHFKHLRDAPATIARFLDGARRLGERLGPVLVQLPPRWRRDVPRLRSFLRAAPADVRWALEFRHPDWLTAEVFELLHRHGAALCIHDLIDRHPRVVTADWTYLRFHGGSQPDGGYPHQALVAWARRIREWLDDGTGVFAFFNNDFMAAAVRDARRLARYTNAA